MKDNGHLDLEWLEELHHDIEGHSNWADVNERLSCAWQRDCEVDEKGSVWSINHWLNQEDCDDLMRRVKEGL